MTITYLNLNYKQNFDNSVIIKLLIEFKGVDIMTILKNLLCGAWVCGGC